MSVTILSRDGENYIGSQTLAAAGNTNDFKRPEDAWELGFQLILGATTSGYVQTSIDGTNWDTWPYGTVTGGNKTGRVRGSKFVRAVQTTAGSLTLYVTAKRELNH